MGPFIDIDHSNIPVGLLDENSSSWIVSTVDSRIGASVLSKVA